jgi:hypothetical protein
MVWGTRKETNVVNHLLHVFVREFLVSCQTVDDFFQVIA